MHTMVFSCKEKLNHAIYRIMDEPRKYYIQQGNLDPERRRSHGLSHMGILAFNVYICIYSVRVWA